MEGRSGVSAYHLYGLGLGARVSRLELITPIQTSSEIHTKPPVSFFLQIHLGSILLRVPIIWIIAFWEHIRKHVLGGAIK